MLHALHGRHAVPNLTALMAASSPSMGECVRADSCDLALAALASTALCDQDLINLKGESSEHIDP